MAKQKTAEVRELTDADITKRIDEIRKELFDLRFQQATRQLIKTHRFKEVRTELAQLMTVKSERSRSISS